MFIPGFLFDLFAFLGVRTVSSSSTSTLDTQATKTGYVSWT